MKQLKDITAWSHFIAVVNDQTLIGRKVNDDVAVCQNFTSNDKSWALPAYFGSTPYKIRPLSQTAINRYKKAGWFNEHFYKVYDNYENSLKAQAA